ncbi:alpha/beta hydrolase [Microbulbifer sp. JMSA004]|uniref:alpha/beta hydrolase n=1 Tax=unclassified Microbulbifer TaxID=2619833 RepID=UPI00403AC106
MPLNETAMGHHLPAKNTSKFNIAIIIIATCLTMPACSKRIATLIERSKSFPFTETITPEEVSDLDFKKDQFCTKNRENCVSYYYASPLPKNRLSYSVTFDAHDQESTVNLNISREQLKNKYKGTIILFHGFRASKEFMLHSALYFRFLGFKVIIPDLLGHGESNNIKKYGVGDSKIINQLINNLIKKGEIEDKNLYLLGNSMGALTALYISTLRSDITGIILLAPMLPFDQAFYNYARLNHPILSRIIPDKDIRRGANLALERSDIEPSETNILPLLNASKIPVLLISSSTDRIAPYSNYMALDQSNIELIESPNRNHPSMATIGEIEHRAIINWLDKKGDVCTSP